MGKVDIEARSDAEWHEDFCEQLREYDYDDSTAGWKAPHPNTAAVMRYVRARKGDLAAAVKQYVQAERFFFEQKTWTMDSPDPLEECYAATCPHLNAGFGREGEPLYFERTGVINQAELLKITHPKDLVWRHVRQQELFIRRAQKKSAELGKLIEKQIIIMDMKGLSFWPNPRAFAVFKETIRIDQAYYPERLKAVFFINSPLIFRPIWGAIRPWLDPLTRDKFHVLGSSYQEALLEKIAPENLPEEYGGTMSVGLAPLVPLDAEGQGWAMERAKDIEAGNTGRGHYASGEGPVTPPWLPPPPAKPTAPTRPSLTRPSSVTSKRSSTPWIVPGARGSLWL